jgi:hypothetical protein
MTWQLLRLFKLVAHLNLNFLERRQGREAGEKGVPDATDNVGVKVLPIGVEMAGSAGV